MLVKLNINTDRPSHSLDYKNLGPFKIIEVIDNHSAYRLQLPETMSAIHPVFHPWLLHLDSSRPLRGQRRQPSPPVRTTEGYTEHEAIAIVESRINKRKKDSKPDPALPEKERDCLQYQFRYQNDEKHNQNPNWHDDTEVQKRTNLIADFHHVNPDNDGPHWKYQTPDDWEPLT